jgi:hypothetical protein
MEVHETRLGNSIMTECMKRISLLLIITAMTSISTNNLVSASQCESVTPFVEEFKKSKAVFAGTVIKRAKARPDKIIVGGEAIYEEQIYCYVTFEVKRSWKGIGKSERVITVRAWRERLGCSKDFRDGDAYLIYAREGGEKNERLWIDCCSRTGRMDKAGDDLQKLEAIKSRRGVRKRGG